MKKIILTIFFLIFFSNISYSKEVNLSCDLSSFFIKKSYVTDEMQIPLDKVDAVYFNKVTLKFDVDNKTFLGSNLITPDEYKKVLFTDEEIFFLTKGVDDEDHFAFYDTRLNRLNGQLTRIMQPTKAYLRKQAEKKDGPNSFGFKQTEIYQCKVVDKLF